MKLRKILTEIGFTTWVNFHDEAEKAKAKKQLQALGFYIARDEGNSLYVQGDNLNMKDIFSPKQKDIRKFKFKSTGPKN